MHQKNNNTSFFRRLLVNDRCPWPFLSFAVGCNLESAARMDNLEYGYPKILGLLDLIVKMGLAWLSPLTTF